MMDFESSIPIESELYTWEASGSLKLTHPVIDNDRTINRMKKQKNLTCLKLNNVDVGYALIGLFGNIC
jgi:hypothetical protein